MARVISRRARRRHLARRLTYIPADVWLRLAPYEKLEALYGASLEMCRVALCEWPIDPSDPPRMLFQDRVRHDVMMIVARAGLQAMEVRAKEEHLQELAKALDEVG